MQSQTFTRAPASETSFRNELDNMIRKLSTSDEHPVRQLKKLYANRESAAQPQNTPTSLSEIDFKLTASPATRPADKIEVQKVPAPFRVSGLASSVGNAQSLCRMKSPSKHESAEQHMTLNNSSLLDTSKQQLECNPELGPDGVADF